MAMLAEPRRQKKRYNLTPRGKALYEDDSRFGTKMLEKMGWSKGKGLGANEDGSKDFVHVRMRNTNEGLGYEDRDDHWTQHEQDFNGLLKTLNGAVGDAGTKKNDKSGSDEETTRIGFGFATEPKRPKLEKLKDKISGISLEEKSKKSKARVHYQKFTKGKDIAQYSEKDLANIFGKKAVESELTNGMYAEFGTLTMPRPEKQKEKKPEEKGVKPNFAFVQTISTGLSVSDYFKQKMKEMKNKQKQECNETFVQVKHTQVADLQTLDTEKKSKKRKKTHKSVEDESNYNMNTPEDTKSKMPKKKENRRENSSDSDASETVIEIKKENKKKRHEIESADFTQENVKELKEKKSKEIQDELHIDNFASTSTDQLEQTFVLKQHKKSKKAKIEKEKMEEAFHSLTKAKTKKKKDIKSTTTDEADTLLPATAADIVFLDDVGVKKKKKSKKTEKQDNETNDKNRECPFESLQCNAITDTSKQKHNKKNVSEEQSIESMTLAELIAKYNSCNVYTISSFCAEKFRNVDLDCFHGATLSHLPGYSHSGTDLQLNIAFFPNDQQRITELWNCRINKYQHANPKAVYFKYKRNMVNAYQAKTKHLPRLHMKSFKRKSIFQPI